ncbi:peptidase S49 [Parvibaculum lavamentivorans DS-1]|uniref:Peptidase S49 n=1 Tax=Parvibaculum lavamentivorans (strain DS-1 / DSM 13023 / NCIMB 13966) TaxID=402881 RepID=A7HR15_PARL1|nr:S49 family peptidase [Parvibaculum lavamentivorans]ABS62348.1 peptidase S49 [Parvibaculum lavamentivorans DS-1]
MKNIIAPYLPSPLRKRVAPDWEPKPVVAVVRLSGTIGPSQPLRGGLNLAAVAAPLEAAFSMRNVKAVALLINSPGGSPVQSSLIYKRIRALAEEKSVPVYAFAEDVAASGGYMIACAADEIYADESSIVGSIGVVSAGFGFTGLIEKLGVERRVHTAGESKAMLDPFQPEREEDVRRLEALQLDVHENFKKLVRGARGERLKADDPAIFSGEFWAGQGAVERGLIDGLGDVRSKMRSLFGENVKLRLVSPRTPWWRPGGGIASSRFGGLSEGFGAGFASQIGEGLIAAAERRSLWSRFGL